MQEPKAEPVVTMGDNPCRPAKVHNIVIVLDRLRSAYNVGNIFRLAEVCAIEKVITCGYTATPPHPKLQKTARGCDERVSCVHYPDSLTAVTELKSAGYYVVGVETVEGAPDVWEITFPFPLALVFGNEALGIAGDTLQACDAFARLPVFGVKNSMNVSNCAAVVLYEAVRQHS